MDEVKRILKWFVALGVLSPVFLVILIVLPFGALFIYFKSTFDWAIDTIAPKSSRKIRTKLKLVDRPSRESEG